MRRSNRAVQFISVSLTILMLGVSPSLWAGDLDLSNGHWNFNIGGGFTPIVGGMSNQLTNGWNFSVGTGYDLNEKLGFVLEYGSHNGGIQDGILKRYSNRLGGASTDGTTRIWSLTLNPKYKFRLNRVVGGYVIGGGGYYHVNAQVTTPGVAFMPGYCDPFWGCWPGGLVGVDNIVAERKDDTGGVNLGAGITFVVSHDVDFYIESRYHYILLHGADIQLLPITAGFRY